MIWNYCPRIRRRKRQERIKRLENDLKESEWRLWHEQRAMIIKTEKTHTGYMKQKMIFSAFEDGTQTSGIDLLLKG